MQVFLFNLACKKLMIQLNQEFDKIKLLEIFNTALLSGNDEMGGEYSGLTIILASGISASASHLTPTDKKFINNEGTIIELGGVKNRYHCPMSRTVYYR